MSCKAVDTVVAHWTDGQCPSVQVLALVTIFYWSSKPGGNDVDAGFRSIEVVIVFFRKRNL